MSGGKFNPWYVDVEHPTRRLSLIQVSLTSSSKAQGSWMDEHCVPWLRALLHRVKPRVSTHSAGACCGLFITSSQLSCEGTRPPTIDPRAARACRSGFLGSSSTWGK